MSGDVRLALLSIILTVGLLTPGVSGGTQRAPTVAISVDRKFREDGLYNFEISERGVGPTGSYQRKLSFAAEITQGVGVPTKFRNYEAVMTTQRAGIWKTRREPIAGYLYIFFEGGRAYAELRLLESWDGHPVRMTINGVYPLAVR